MAEGVVDRLVIATEFDESGLDRGTKAQLAHLERFVAQVGQISRSLPPITVDTTQITAALQQAGGDLDAFARILGQLSPAEFVTALDQMVQELGEAGGQFKATSTEGRTLQAAIEALRAAQVSAVGATQSATTALTQEAGAARLTANTATELAAALERTGLATRRLASQGTQPIGLNIQPAINAADTLISRMGLAQRSVNSVRQVLATPLPPIPPDPNLPILARGYQLLALEVQLADQRLSGLKATMLQAGQASRLASNANAAAKAEIAGLGLAMRNVSGGFDVSTQQASKLRSGLTALAVSATGASGPVGQLAQSLLLFGGTGAVAGVAAGVLVIAGAYRFLTTAAREAREEQDRLVQSLLSEASSAIPKAVQAQLGLVAALEAERRARETLGQIRALAPVAAAVPAIGGLTPRFSEEFARRQIKAIQDADRAQRQAQENQKRGVLEFFTLNSRTLTESISLRQADTAEIGRARGLVTALLALERDTTLTIGQQLEIHRERLSLQQALTAESERTLTFWKQFRAAEEQILDAQIQLVRLGFGDPSILTKALTEAAATARDLTATEEARIAAANRLNTAAAALVAPLERQVQATGASADNILRAFRATQSLTGLDAVLGLTADSAQVTDEIAKAERELAALRSQAVSLRIDGDAAPVLRSIAAVEARLADLRTQRAQITLSGDSQALTDQIAEAESQLEQLQAQGGVAIGIDGDASGLLVAISKVEVRLASLRGERGAITLTGDTTRLTQQITEAEEQLARLRAEGVALTLTADPTEILRQIATVEDRLAQLRGQGKLIALAGDTDTGPLARQIADLDASLGRLRASGAAATDAFRQMQQQRTGLVEKQREAEQLVAAFQRIGEAPLELKFSAAVDLANPDRALAELLKELQQRADERVFGLTLKALRVPVEVDTSLLGDADRALENLNSDLAKQNPIWREANAQAAKMVRKLDDARTNAERFADSLADAVALMDAFAEFGTATGILSEQDIRAFQTFQDAATSIGKFATGDIVGGLVAALDTLGGIFGKSAMQQEHEAILRENSAAINRNTIAQNERLQGASGVGLGQSAVAAAQANEAFKVLEGISLLGLSTAALEEALEGTGLSLQELDAIARDNDIQLLDSKGRLVAGALDQLDIALKQANERLTHFGTSLEAQSARMATRDKLGLGPNAGLPEDVQALARTRDLQLSGLVLDPQLEARIAGLDLATEEGRQAFLEFNRMLFGMAERGELTAEQLDKFGSVDNLNLSLGTAGDQITAFGEAALDAANELSIVPKGFRQAALAFEAQIPGLTAPLPPLPLPPPPLPPPPPPAPTVDEAIPPGEAITADAALERLIPEPILITGAELLDRMVAFGAIPATTGLPTGVPSDGAALPQIAATLTSSHAVLAQIAAALGASGTPDALASQRGNEAITRLLEFLANAKIGHTVEHVSIEIDSDGNDPRDVALEIRRALENISMADYGRTDRWGQT